VLRNPERHLLSRVVWNIHVVQRLRMPSLTTYPQPSQSSLHTHTHTHARARARARTIQLSEYFNNIFPSMPKLSELILHDTFSQILATCPANIVLIDMLVFLIHGNNKSWRPPITQSAALSCHTLFLRYRLSDLRYIWVPSFSLKHSAVTSRWSAADIPCALFCTKYCTRCMFSLTTSFSLSMWKSKRNDLHHKSYSSLMHNSHSIIHQMLEFCTVHSKNVE
jgi:hypothetical protein